MFVEDEICQIPEELLKLLRTGAGAGVLVVGIGSPHAGDGVGWELADLIAQQKLSGVAVRRALVPLDLLDWIEDYPVIHVIDAMQGTSNAAPWRMWCWPACEELASSGTTSHSFDLISVLHLANALGRIKSKLFIWGVLQPKVPDHLTKD